MPPRDAELIDAARRGEARACEELFRATYNEVYAFIAYRSSSTDMLDECLQQTYIIGFRRLDAFDDRLPLTPWLKGIASNVIGKYLRRLRRESSGRSIPLDALPELPCAEETTELRSSLPLTERLPQCLEKLSRHLQELIDRRYRAGDSVATIARDRRRSENSVSAALYRARTLLRKCLEATT